MKREYIYWADATVHTVSPLTVYFDGDTPADSVPVAKVAAGITGLGNGSRVTVHFYEGRSVIAVKW